MSETTRPPQIPTELSWLWEHQKKLGINDAELSRRLDVDPAHILRLQSGERVLTLRLARRILVVFPELTWQVHLWLNGEKAQ